MPVLDPGLTAYAEEIDRFLGPVRQPRVTHATLGRPVVDHDPRGRVGLVIAGLKRAAAFLRAAQHHRVPSRRPFTFAAGGEQREHSSARRVEVKTAHLSARSLGHHGDHRYGLIGRRAHVDGELVERGHLSVQWYQGTINALPPQTCDHSRQGL